MSEQAALPSALVVGHKKDGRCIYSPEAKRALIEMALQPGVSVAKLARQNDLNANVLRRWIVVHQNGPKSGRGLRRASAGTLVPVIELRQKPVVTASSKPDSAGVAASAIEIDVGGMTLRLRGAVDAVQLRTVLDCVRRA